ncbi:unnamed protein product [Closterium sp. NIES-53]
MQCVTVRCVTDITLQPSLIPTLAYPLTLSPLCHSPSTLPHPSPLPSPSPPHLILPHSPADPHGKQQLQVRSRQNAPLLIPLPRCAHPLHRFLRGLQLPPRHPPLRRAPPARHHRLQLHPPPHHPVRAHALSIALLLRGRGKAEAEARGEREGGGKSGELDSNAQHRTHALPHRVLPAVSVALVARRTDRREGGSPHHPPSHQHPPTAGT